MGAIPKLPVNVTTNIISMSQRVFTGTAHATSARGPTSQTAKREAVCQGEPPRPGQQATGRVHTLVERIVDRHRGRQGHRKDNLRLSVAGSAAACSALCAACVGLSGRVSLTGAACDHDTIDIR